ncbi:MAG: hypothetical protein QE487_11115 [Fluviicola sp.]|nr:hypothetical protein [Fluviicola sp.]
MQAQVDFLISRGEAEDFESFNDSLDRLKNNWLTEYNFLSLELRSRIVDLSGLKVEEKQRKHSWWSGINAFGINASQQFTVDELREDIRLLRGQLASIEFLFKSTIE